MTTLTPEQRLLVDRAGAEPVLLEHPETHQAYVLVTSEAYERMRKALEERQDVRDQRYFLEASHESAVEWMKANPY